MESNEGLFFKDEIKSQLGQFIIVIIKSGANCCRYKGVLCSIEEDFLVLLDDDFIIEIFFDDVVAIKRKVTNSKEYMGL